MIHAATWATFKPNLKKIKKSAPAPPPPPPQKKNDNKNK